MSFAEKLKEIRLQKGMSLSEFANLLGTSKQVLCRYEHGDNTPKITTVQKYSEILNVPLSFLTDEDTVSPTKAKLIDMVSDMDEAQMKEVMRYIEFVKRG